MTALPRAPFLLARRLPPTAAFWMLTVTLAFLFFASSAPSPLYVVYQSAWHFSALTLTSVFAVYVLALMTALVLAGSLSDRVGRRPVLVAALLTQAAGMVLFALAHDVTLLFAARIVQGLATGVATGAISAALIDLQPGHRPTLGSLLSSTAPPLGLAAGALGSGLLVQYAPDPMRLIYWLLVAVFVVAVAGVLAMPETVAARGGWASMLRPRIGVPQAARGTFVAVAPVLLATWALGGLYLSLGPSLAASLLHSSSHVTGGLVIVALTATGAFASLAVRGHRPEHTMIAGATLLAVGVGLTLIGLNQGSTALFFAGSVVAGAGFGPSFAGAFKTVIQLAPAAERAGLIAAVYVLAYLGFSLPAIAAGVAVAHQGLLHTTNVYGIAVMALAAWATGVSVVRQRRGGFAAGAERAAA
ncbi:MAG TPA: MFS transporter [Baekduia sp.]|uniref:MFS transporter n=1 Tax=Baekduia sp. TaxID=2600305 RepID=UPI002CD09E63|nr:MFS transporter [Baekduia sp.]HMJ37469.1 MFS transporter [Baekduia sp.]